jgi:hypothetical protein
MRTLIAVWQGLARVTGRAKDINSLDGRSDTRCFKMETGEQCILGKWKDNGANHAPNIRIKVSKTPKIKIKTLSSSVT